jgi:hypothetical protein
MRDARPSDANTTEGRAAKFEDRRFFHGEIFSMAGGGRMLRRISGSAELFFCVLRAFLAKAEIGKAEN